MAGGATTPGPDDATEAGLPAVGPDGAPRVGTGASAGPPPTRADGASGGTGASAGPPHAAGHPFAQTSPIVAGQRLGPYEIRRELGRGGMGVVFLAHDPRARRDVALKVLRDQGLATAAEVARFQIEAQAAARLEHPGIVPVYDVGVDQGRPYFAMRYVAGKSLDAALNDESIDARRAAAIIAQVAETLAYAHAQGVIHRDVKPGNILLTADGRAVLTDFGLARDERATVRLSKSGEAMGTPAYMAPEQAKGELARIGPATDVYGLGATLYELCTGRPPFDGATPFEVLSKVVRGDPVPPHKISATVPLDLATICQKALEKDPAARYPSAAELAADCRRFAAGQPILARPRSLAWHVGQFVARHRAAVGAAAVLAAAAAAFAGWWLTRPGTLLVTVTPPGATVHVAGTAYTAGAAPLAVTVRPGQWVVRAEAPDHEPALREATVARNATREVRLDLARATGRLTVETFPRATVRIGDQGHGTPLRTTLPTGPHRVWIEEPGFHRVPLDVAIAVGAEVRRQVTLIAAQSWFHEGTHWNVHVPYGDVDGDGVADLFHYVSGTTLTVVSGATGRQLLAQPREGVIWSPFRAIDTDGDGRVECVTIERDGAAFRLRARRPADGTVAWESGPLDPARLDDLADGHGGSNAGDLPLCWFPDDLDGDGQPDALVIERPARLRAFAGTGRPLWSHDLPAATLWCTTAGDLDGDRVDELCFAWSGGIRLVSGRTGALVWQHDRAAGARAEAYLPPGADLVGSPEPDAYVVLDRRTGAVRARQSDAGVPATGLRWAGGPVRGVDADRRTAFGLATGADGAVTCWDLRTGARCWTVPPTGPLARGEGTHAAWLAEPGAPPVAVCFGADGRACTLRDGATGAVRWTGTFADEVWLPIGPLRFAPDGPRVAAVFAGAELRLVDCDTGVEALRWRAPGPLVTAGPVADFDRDGAAELFLGTSAGHVLAIDAAGAERFGALLPHPVNDIEVRDLDADGWQDALVQSPKGASAVRANRVLWRLELADDARAGMCVADANGDGTPDVIAFVVPRGEQAQRITAVDGRTGTVRWQGADRLDGFRSAALVDVTGDGVPEVAHWRNAGSRNALGLFDLRTGAPVATIPIDTWGYAEPSVGDLDGDGADDVVLHGWYDHGRSVAVSGRTRAVLWSHAAGFAWSGSVVSAAGGAGPADVFVTNYGAHGTRVSRLDGRTGQPRWVNESAGGARAGVAVGPLGFDARWTVVVNAADGALRFLDAGTGEAWGGLEGGGGTTARPALVDVDGDGSHEVVIGYRGGLACVDAAGTVRWRAGDAAVIADPVIADLDGDGAREVIVGDVRGTIWVVDLATGARRWAWREVEARARTIEAAVALLDADGDGVLDIVYAGTDDSLTCLCGRAGRGR